MQNYYGYNQVKAGTTGGRAALSGLTERRAVWRCVPADVFGATASQVATQRTVSV